MLILFLIINGAALAFHLYNAYKVINCIQDIETILQEHAAKIESNTIVWMNDVSSKIQFFVEEKNDSRIKEIKTIFKELEMTQASIEGIRNVKIRAIEEDIQKLFNKLQDMKSHESK